MDDSANAGSNPGPGAFAGVRPMTAVDLDDLAEIDGTIESTQYVHLVADEPSDAEPLQRGWRIETRPLGETLVLPNRLDKPDDATSEVAFIYKQVVRGVIEGVARQIGVGDRPAAAALAVRRPEVRLLELTDLRVDYDVRRQGFASAMLYALLSEARADDDLRAVLAQVPANNEPAHRLLAKLGFELAGFDTMRQTNHDLVKEQATLLWYMPLDA